MIAGVFETRGKAVYLRRGQLAACTPGPVMRYIQKPGHDAADKAFGENSVA
ncbi:hypothetical protein D9M68_933960 [compost metagenome]